MTPLSLSTQPLHIGSHSMGRSNVYNCAEMPKLYDSLADWWPLLSAPSEYEEEAAVYRKYLESNCGCGTAATLLELGSGGGNIASHLKHRFKMTLTDVSPGMLAASEKINPECEHLKGDMRTIRLGRTFDCVFIHDAICYMATQEDLRLAIETAFVHCKPGGVLLVVPDFVQETFSPSTDHGGYDGHNRGLRYLEWTWAPEPSDSTYTVDYVYAMRDANVSTRIEYDRHIEGLFYRDEWLQILESCGLRRWVEAFEHTDVERTLDVFVGLKPGK